MSRIMQEPKTYRPTPEVQLKINEIREKHQRYKSDSDILRAGVFALERWLKSNGVRG